MKKTQIRKQHIIQALFSLIIIILIAFISTRIFFRVDLTSEQRFTLSGETKTNLKKVDDIIYVKVYLEGDLPVGFKKLHNAIKETLDEFRIYAKDNIQYEFINPSENSDTKVRNKIYGELYHKGLKPVNIQSHDKEGGSNEKIIFPGALISYKGIEVPVGFLKNNVTLSPDENLNNSIQTIEYELIKIIYNFINKKVEKVAFLFGQGELDPMEVQDITLELGNYFQVDQGAIDGKPGILNDYKAIIIARPTKPFNEQDKFVLDQYIMNGGKVLWLVDAVKVNTDSLAKGSTFGFINNTNIDDLLFTYGVRVNPNLVQDVQCNTLPINASLAGNQPKWVPTPWPYYPLISPIVDHPITRNLNLVWARYASQIDTIATNKVKKTFLLKTSAYTKLVNAPSFISLDEVRRTPSRNEFNKSNQPIAVLLEGQFQSVYRNRPVKNIMPGAETSYKALSVPTKMIVVADGKLIANDVRMTQKGPMITALGFDKYTSQTFGNKDFIVNALNYLTDESGLISLRAKEFKLRVLNKTLIREERFKWQMINIVLPVLLIIGFGLYYNYSRKKKYSV
jgi:gliding-associated putative ABC transporter substrate-binding component GldG